jgi:hypothetical protein
MCISPSAIADALKKTQRATTVRNHKDTKGNREVRSLVSLCLCGF